MTLAVTVYVPTGIILAADSRLIINSQETLPDGRILLRQKVASDRSRKVVAFGRPAAGVAMVGHHFVGGQPTNRLLERFVAERAERLQSPGDLAEALAAEFDAQFPLTSPTGFFVESPGEVASALAASFRGVTPTAAPDIGFYVAGYQEEEGTLQPYVAYVGSSPRRVQRLNHRPDAPEIIYGAAWAGDREIVDRLLKNAPLVPFEFLATEDAIRFAIDLIEITARMQRWRPAVESVGGPIDILLITPESIQWVQQKGGE
jgi:hypothetical protein